MLDQHLSTKCLVKRDNNQPKDTLASVDVSTYSTQPSKSGF